MPIYVQKTKVGLIYNNKRKNKEDIHQCECSGSIFLEIFVYEKQDCWILNL